MSTVTVASRASRTVVIERTDTVLRRDVVREAVVKIARSAVSVPVKTSTTIEVGIPGVQGPPGAGGALPPGAQTGDVLTETHTGVAWRDPSIDWTSTNW